MGAEGKDTTVYGEEIGNPLAAALKALAETDPEHPLSELVTDPELRETRIMDDLLQSVTRIGRAHAVEEFYGRPVKSFPRERRQAEWFVVWNSLQDLTEENRLHVYTGLLAAIQPGTPKQTRAQIDYMEAIMGSDKGEIDQLRIYLKEIAVDNAVALDTQTLLFMKTLISLSDYPSHITESLRRFLSNQTTLRLMMGADRGIRPLQFVRVLSMWPSAP